MAPRGRLYLFFMKNIFLALLQVIQQLVLENNIDLKFQFSIKDFWSVRTKKFTYFRHMYT